MKHFGFGWILIFLLTSVKCFPNYFESHFEIPIGKFWSFYGFQIEVSLELPSFEVTSLSHCRAICFTTNCSTFSMSSNYSEEDSEPKIKCRITKIPLHELTLYPSNGSVSEAKEKSFELFHGFDGVFYSQPLRELKEKSDLEETCKNFNDNGRIPILKTLAQYESYWSFREAFNLTEEGSFSFLDMTFDFAVNDHKWPDGTYYKETELFPIVHFIYEEARSEEFAATAIVKQGVRRSFEERIRSDLGLSICQVDPFVDFENAGLKDLESDLENLPSQSNDPSALNDNLANPDAIG